MNYVSFLTKAEADSVVAKVNAEKGYPKVGEGVCTATPVGGGRHVTHPHCCTVTHVKVVEGKTPWAVPVPDADVRKQLPPGSVEMDSKLYVDRKEPAPTDSVVKADAESPVRK